MHIIDRGTPDGEAWRAAAGMLAPQIEAVPEDPLFDLGLTDTAYPYLLFLSQAETEAALVEKRNELIARGVDVTDVVDHDWAKSIYFKDPNGLQLEFCCFTRNLNGDDARLQERAEVSIRRMGLEGAGAPSPIGNVKVG